SEVARSLGKPKAVRAVARACATNPVSIVVPCHRVIREDGTLAGYRWGLSRKEQLLAQERAAGEPLIVFQRVQTSAFVRIRRLRAFKDQPRVLSTFTLFGQSGLNFVSSIFRFY